MSLSQPTKAALVQWTPGHPSQCSQQLHLSCQGDTDAREPRILQAYTISASEDLLGHPQNRALRDLLAHAYFDSCPRAKMAPMQRTPGTLNPCLPQVPATLSGDPMHEALQEPCLVPHFGPSHPTMVPPAWSASGHTSACTAPIIPPRQSLHGHSGHPGLNPLWC